MKDGAGIKSKLTQFIAGCLIFSTLLGPRSMANENIDDVYAVLILKIIRYVEWPNHEKKSDLSIGVFQNPGVYKSLKKFSQMKEKFGFTAKVIEIKSFEELAKKRLNSTFFGLADKGALKIYSAATKPHSTVIFSAQKGYAKHGSHINLFIENKQPGFEVNNKTLTERHIKVSSKLLKLARIVE